MRRDAADLVIPKGVGPHAGRELSLMLAGQKSLAMFSDSVRSQNWFPESQFAPYVAHGLFVRRERVYWHPQGGGIRFVYFAQAGEEWRIERMQSIHSELYGGGRRASERDHIEIGLLLGYGEEDIATFLCHARSLQAGAPGRARAVRAGRAVKQTLRNVAIEARRVGWMRPSIGLEARAV